MGSRLVLGAVLAVIALVPGASAPPGAPPGRAAVRGATTGERGAVNKVERSTAPGRFAAIPPSFEPNVGQSAGEVRFLSRGNGYVLFLTATGAVLELREPGQRPMPGSPARPGESSARVVRMAMLGANSRTEAVGTGALPGVSNYLTGDDPTAWRTGVPHYSSVAFRDVYPGIGLAYHGGPSGRLEYDFTVRPGADPSRIRLAFHGQDGMFVDERGNLVLRLPGLDLRQPPPLIYQPAGNRRRVIPGGYLVTGDRVGFEVGTYDPTRSLVIDPTVVYGTYLGGHDFDAAASIDEDSDGEAYVTGATLSSDFPTATPFQGSRPGGSDAFVTKLSSDGSTLLYSTYLGGGGNDAGLGIQIDANRDATVTGSTSSSDFPVTPGAFQTAYGTGPSRAFVTRLFGSGDELAYSTYIGGSGADVGLVIRVDWGTQDSYVGGATTSPDFPTVHPIQRKLRGERDGWVARLTADGSALTYSTYLGGKADDEVFGMAVDPAGQAYVGGSTSSKHFPVRHAFQRRLRGGRDGFVAGIAPAGTLLFSTYLGGTGDDTVFRDALSPNGDLTVAGKTSSDDFPVTPGVVQPSRGGGSDGFVTRLDSNGSRLIYSTYLGGGKDEAVLGLGIQPVSDLPVVAGYTSSADFEVTGDALSSALRGGTDAFVTELGSGGGSLAWSSFVGGGGPDGALDLSVRGFAGFTVVCGFTASTDFPSTGGAAQPGYGGAGDGWVMSLTFSP